MTDNFHISTLDMTTANTALAITEGAVCDPPYLYVTPHNDFVIAKIDTRSFKVVDTLDLSEFDPTLVGMLGSFIVGHFLYILPHMSNTGPVYQDNVVRVDLNNFTPQGCTKLAVMDASAALYGSYGFTNGDEGYLSLHLSKQAGVTRFGLGPHFNAASVSTVTITTIEGFPVLLGNLVAVDKKAAYVICTVITFPGTGKGDRTLDLWLATIPTKNFTLAAVEYQRLTKLPFIGASVPVAYPGVDDGKNLWIFPIPITQGPQIGKIIGTMQIPKKNPAAVKIYQAPPAQIATPTASTSGTPFYDGKRYAYSPSQTTPQIIQLDTQNPGVINLIDISANSAGYPMYGLGYDGHWAYADSFNGGAGICLRFLPTQKHDDGCPCGHDDDDGGHGDDDEQGGGDGHGDNDGQ